MLLTGDLQGLRQPHHTGGAEAACVESATHVAQLVNLLR